MYVASRDQIDFDAPREVPVTGDIAPEMRAIRLHAAGGPQHLAFERIETPRPAAGEALVRVHAAAVDRVFPPEESRSALRAQHGRERDRQDRAARRSMTT